MTAKGVELTYTIASGVPLTPGGKAQVKAQVEALQSAWAWIESIRAHSDLLEAEVLALDFGGLSSWKQHDWPTNPDARVTL
jgi:hypothetical protein